MERVIYDRDLRCHRVIVRVLIVGLLVTAGLSLWRHAWPVALICGIWIYTCRVALKIILIRQEIRDDERIAHAGIRALMEEQER